MSENNENGKGKLSAEVNDKKKSFGSLKPLTAIQIISLIVPSSPVSAGACY
jgi:hypothetical protein